MRSRIFTISFFIFMIIMWIHDPLLAQIKNSQLPRIPSSLRMLDEKRYLTNSQAASPLAPGATQALPPSSGLPSTGSPNAYQSGSSLTQSSISSQQGVVNTQGSDVSQPTMNSQDSAQQQESQSTTSTLNSETIQIPDAGLQPEALSSIESAFQDISLAHSPADEGAPLMALHQFGYSIFNRNISTFAPIDNVPVGSDYVLGPGDELRITIWGSLENTYIQTVDHYGRIYLPTIGPVRVWGLNFSQAEKLILAHLSRYYKDFQSSVTMGHLRTIRVYIVGEVAQPGAYNISALSTITNALFAAGGPNKTGSLRNIQLKRNQHMVEYFDFYDFLLRGDKSRDLRLEAGDVIFVPPIGSIAGIMGKIKRPAIYELKEPIRINDLITMAGGLTPQSYLKRVQIIRTKPNAEREVIDLDLTHAEKDGTTPKGIELQNGDLVIIYPTDPRIYNTFSLNGSIKHPGEYEVKPGITIRQVLPPESLLPEAYLDNVEIIRFKDDLTTEVIHINLKKLWEDEHAQDIFIQPHDLITVRSEFKAPESITLTGEFKRPGTYTIQPGERLSSVIRRAGNFTNVAYLKGAVFTRKAVQVREKEMLDQFVKQYEEGLLAEGQALLSYSAENRSIRELEIAQRRQQLKLIASRVTLGRIVIHLDTIEKFEGSQNDLILQDGDILTVPREPVEVMVLGSVRNPTSFVYKNGKNIQYYLNRGGGFSKAADKKEIYLLKADGSALIGFLKLRNIDPGDAIVVPPKIEIKDWTWIKDVATIAGQTALTFAALSILL